MVKAIAPMLRDFLQKESAGGITLIVAAILALIVANSPLLDQYNALLGVPVVAGVGGFVIDKPLLLWINDGLMAVFFFLVGLEVKREVLEGQLSSWDKASLPLVAAVGGMAIPALVYLSINAGTPANAAGWAIPAATDIAFALGILMLLGPRVPVALKALLLAIAVIDDIGAIAIIAVFYTGNIDLGMLGAGAIVLVLLGLAFFLEGLEAALFPLGKLMAQQLTDPAFIIQGSDPDNLNWWSYKWVYLFAFAIGFSTTIAEPSLLAVAIKANQVSAGSIGIWGLRIAVALGVAVGIALGAYRIVTGTPLYWYIITGYIFVVIQTWYAPKMIIALAYDSGGVTTSTVTVPLVAALGLGLSTTVPGRSALLDGFGLIAFASLFPIMSVMAYAQLSEWKSKRKT